MLARIPVDRRAWIPEEETYVIFSAFVYNNEKYLDLLYNEDLVGFAPKFGCFEMYVCSRQIIVAKSGKIQAKQRPVYLRGAGYSSSAVRTVPST